MLNLSSIPLHIKQLLGIHFDKTAGPPPPSRPTAKAGAHTPPPAAAALPHFTPQGIPFRDTTATASPGTDSEWTLMTPSASTERTPELTMADLDELGAQEPPLSTEKAAMIKPHWASGRSVAEIVKLLNARGYGERTVQKYCAAFSRAIGAKEVQA